MKRLNFKIAISLAFVMVADFGHLQSQSGTPSTARPNGYFNQQMQNTTRVNLETLAIEAHDHLDPEPFVLGLTFPKEVQ